MDTPRLMVVEDEAVVRSDLVFCLESFGYRVVAEASRGGEAVERAGATRPDLVLMDVRLDGEPDGIRAAEEITARWPIPVVFLTAHSDPATLERAKGVGPYGFIVKPFHENTLRAAVEMALQRFRLDRKLRADEAWLEAVLGAAGEALVAVDREGRIAYRSPAAAALFGEDSGTVPIDRPARQLRLLDPESLSPLTVVAGLEGPALLDRESGTPLPVVVSVTPIGRSSGGAFGLLVTLRDVGERHRLAEGLRQVQKLEAIGRLAGGIAHDFNNLLTAILGHCDEAAATCPRGPATEHLLQARRAADRAGTLTRQLLAFGRKNTLAEEVIATNALVSRAAGLLAPMLGERIRLQVVPGPDDPHVKADASLVEQALVTLAANARDAMPEGGTLTLAVSAGEGPPGSAPVSFVRISVADTGVGVSEGARQHLFEPYFTTKGRGRGTGLGLASVYGIISQHGGHVTVESQLSVGTRFNLYLPRVTAVAPPVQVAPSVRQPAISDQRTVLLVEDEEMVRNLCATVLRAAGYRVLEAADGRQALAIAKSADIDLLLTDVVMPGLNGPEVYERLGGIASGPPVLFMSAYSDGVLEEMGLLGQGMALLAKPFTVAGLREKVAEVLAAVRA
jgi:signal transduction histidine kinase